MPATLSFAFDNTYARLPVRFHARVEPTRVRAPALLAVNEPLAAWLGLDAQALASPEGVAVLAGNVVPAGAEPIALAYAGHQFGAFVPQLGDGRAILLGELVSTDGRRRDVQLKGAGRTPFSRGGDGRAALGPVLREYVVSEAMAALGVPTTRALAAVSTGETVHRDRPLPGAVLARVAASHVRVGTFQYFARRGDREALATLCAYCLERHHPEADRSRGDAAALLDAVIAAQAELVARWLGVGFVHGVMNTDNTTISGETIDYGPCAFLDEYRADKVFSSIDHGGRYAFGNQPRIAQWNVTRLAEALLPVLAEDEDRAVAIAEDRLARFPERFEAANDRVFREKLGLARAEEGDGALLEALLERMSDGEVDFTLFFRRLSDAAEEPSADAHVAALFARGESFHEWALAWRSRLSREDVPPEARAAAMRNVSPAVIPRNHRIEEAIVAAERGDFAPFDALVEALAAPYAAPARGDLAEPPRVHERVRRTFCGT